MSRKVVVLVFHGIGTYRADFDNPKTRFDRPLWDGLYRRMGEALRSEVVWVPVLWSLPDLEAYEADLVGDPDRMGRVVRLCGVRPVRRLGLPAHR